MATAREPSTRATRFIIFEEVVVVGLETCDWMWVWVRRGKRERFLWEGFKFGERSFWLGKRPTPQEPGKRQKRSRRVVRFVCLEPLKGRGSLCPISGHVYARKLGISRGYELRVKAHTKQNTAHEQSRSVRNRELDRRGTHSDEGMLNNSYSKKNGPNAGAIRGGQTGGQSMRDKAIWPNQC